MNPWEISTNQAKSIATSHFYPHYNSLQRVMFLFLLHLHQRLPLAFFVFYLHSPSVSFSHFQFVFFRLLLVPVEVYIAFGKPTFKVEHNNYSVSIHQYKREQVSSNQCLVIFTTNNIIIRCPNSAIHHYCKDMDSVVKIMFQLYIISLIPLILLHSYSTWLYILAGYLNLLGIDK